MDDQNKGMNEQWAPTTDARERGYANDPGYVSGEYGTGLDSDTAAGDVDSERADRRTTEVRREIDRTRADMSETIDAIQDRLRPRNVASRAAEGVRDATVGRVKEFASTMTGGRSSGGTDWDDDDTRYRSSGWDGSPRNGLVDRIRDNPMAAALAAGSIAWLLFGGRRQRSGYQSSWQDRERAMYGSTRGGQAFVREAHIDVDESPSFEGGERDDLGWNQGAASNWRREDDSEGGETGTDVVGRARETASDVGRRARAAASDVRRRGGRFASESPLMTGAFAAALGLAIGLAIPETERENELMGEAKDSIVDRGKDAVRTAAERVQAAAGEVQRVAGDALSGVTPGSATHEGGTPAGQSAGNQAQGSAEATESAVPGMQAGSGGTGSTPATKTSRGAKNR